MRPSDVRRRILEEHAALRGSLADLRDLLRQEGRAGHGARVRELGAALRQRFLAHLELEDRTLLPALRRADAWGEERAARVEREHAEQRRRMEVLLEHLGDSARPAAELAAELEALVEDLLADMEHEDRTVLSEKLLRDDVITLGEPE